MPIIQKNTEVDIARPDVGEKKNGKKIANLSKLSDSIKNVKGKIGGFDKDEEFIKLTELVDNSRIIYHTKTVFPFDFFPDDLVIDKDKVAIVSKYFYASSRQQSIMIKNISDVYADVSILFATLKITDKYFADSSLKVEFLKKKDAIRARDIIQGLIICHEQKVDISGMKRESVLPYLEEIGRATVG